MQKKQRSKSLPTGRRQNLRKIEGYGAGWEISNTSIERENGTNSKEEEMIYDYHPWEGGEEEENDNQSSFDFSSTIKCSWERRRKKRKKREKVDTDDHGGVVTQGAIPTKAPNTED